MSFRTKPTDPTTGNDANTPCDETVKPCQCNFDLALELVGDSDERILTPLSIPDYDELNSGNTKNRDYVTFEMEIKENTVEKVIMEITVGSGTNKKQIYYKVADPKYLKVGTHELTWDGFGNVGTHNNILDTKLLKDPNLELKVTAELCGVQKTKTIEFDNEDAEEDWVDVVIDKSAKQITVELRVNIKDGGEDGVGEAPPSEVLNDPQYQHIPVTDPRKQPHTRVRSFSDMKKLALSGLEKYWSRNSSNGLSISTASGNYTVDVKPISVTEKAMDDINVKYNTNAEWGRSSNPGSVRDPSSFFGNFVPERITYNVGWIEYDSGWYYVMPATEDKDFEETSAHEIGHEILSAYGKSPYSYGHKGSSTLVTQKTKPLSEGGISYPSSGEIDLMKYYNGTRPNNFFSRVVASEVDVKSLLWLARVEFDD